MDEKNAVLAAHTALSIVDEWGQAIGPRRAASDGSGTSGSGGDRSLQPKKRIKYDAVDNDLVVNEVGIYALTNNTSYGNFAVL